jgi:aminoglycoside phosphotransferase (APT) family kinase protein
LVHGDLSGKNLRIRRTIAGEQLLVLDWETAGWGPPAADLPYSPTRAQRPKPGKPLNWDGTVPLDAYAAAAAGQWGGARRRDLEGLARVGTVFRALAGVRWASEQWTAGGSTRRLRWYAELLPKAMALLDG